MPDLLDDLFGSDEPKTPPQALPKAPPQAPKAVSILPPDAPQSKGVAAQKPSAAAAKAPPQETPPGVASAPLESLLVPAGSEVPAYGYCTQCGAFLNSANASKLQSGGVKHLGCPAAAAPKTETAPAPQAVQVPEVAEVKPRTRTKKAEAPAAAPSGEGLRIYIDCVPGPGVSYERLDGYVSSLASRLAKEAGTPDIRCSPKGTPLEYGQWKGLLASAAREEPPSPGVYVLFRDGEFSEIVAEALAPLCVVGFPVRGV